MMRIIASALRHGVTREEIEEVIACGIAVEMPTGTRGLARVMFVGWTYEANLLEVGVEYELDGEDVVFHARKATSYYIKRAGL